MNRRSFPTEVGIPTSLRTGSRMALSNGMYPPRCERTIDRNSAASAQSCASETMRAMIEAGTTGRGYHSDMKTAVITGGGRGLGRLTAERVADRGFRVLVTDVDAASAEDTARRIGRGAWAMKQDVRDPESHRQVAAAAAENGPLKLWVNNAGVLRAALAWAHPDDEVRLQIDVNVFGVMWG